MGYLYASPVPKNASMYCTLISLPSKRIVSKVMPSPGAQSKQKVCGRRPGTGRQTSGSALIRALCNDVAANCGLKILEPDAMRGLAPSRRLNRQHQSEGYRCRVHPPPVVVSVTPFGSAVLKVRIPLELITIVGVISADEVEGERQRHSGNTVIANRGGKRAIGNVYPVEGKAP